MYRRNEINEGNESCISDESCSGRKSCVGNGVPTMVGEPANDGWQWTPTVVGKVRGPREVYIAPIAPIGNQVVFTIKYTSHPAHISNLGKVSTVSYR